ncbi:MAG: phosphoribosyl-ATP diphosphatase [Planctomycetota bacterium]
MVIPSIDIMNGRAVQLIGGDPDGEVLDGGDPRELAARFSVAGQIAVIDLDAALGRGSNRELIQELVTIAPCRVGGGLRDADAALSMLDAGAHHVILGTALTDEVLRELPRGRVCAALDAVHGEVVTHGWQTKTGRSVGDRIAELRDRVGSFLVTFVEREGRMGGIDLTPVEELAAAVGDCSLTVAGGVTTPDEIAALDEIGADAQLGMALYRGEISLGEAVAAPMRRKTGAISTIITDQLGVALGHSFSDAGSIAASIDEDGARFTDERGDAYAGMPVANVAYCGARESVRVSVRVSDPGVHREYPVRHGCSALGRTLEARRAEAPEGSYTKRLFDDAELLASKLSEETRELLEADTAGEAAWEAADVIYFALVAAMSRGASCDDVEAELDRRTRRVRRRKGDAKPAPEGSHS